MFIPEAEFCPTDEAYLIENFNDYLMRSKIKVEKVIVEDTKLENGSYMYLVKSKKHDKPIWVKYYELMDEMLYTETMKYWPNEFPCVFYMAGRIPDIIQVGKKPKGRGLSVCVGSRELKGHPHFHVFGTDQDEIGWCNGACIMYNQNRWFDHSNNTERLTRKEFDAVIDKLKEYSDERGCTWWQVIVDLWNDNNPNYKLPRDIKMPDYDYDTIKRFREK